MRSIMDEFMKTHDVESIDKDLKSQIRTNVDKVFAQMNEKEGNFIHQDFYSARLTWMHSTCIVC